MPLTSFIFGKQPKATTIANALIIDATMSIQHNADAAPTKFPIESGADITDHVKLEPIRLTINGIISEAPLSTLQALFGGVIGGAIGTAVGGLGTAALSSVTKQVLKGNELAGGTNNSLEADMKNRNFADSNFPKKAWEYLLEVREKRVPFSIVTSFREYKNMVIRSLNQSQDKDSGDSLMFTMSVEQLTIVETEIIQLDEGFIEQLAASSGASKANLGKQATETPNPNTAGNGSIAIETLKGIGLAN